MTAGALRAHWLIWGAWRENSGTIPRRSSLYRESIKIFQELDHKRGIARLLECFACSAAAQLEAERSLRLAGAAAALRQNIGAPLTPAEQAKLEASLHPARQALTDTARRDGLAGRLGLPVEKAIEEVLMPEAASSSSLRTEPDGLTLMTKETRRLMGGSASAYSALDGSRSRRTAETRLAGRPTRLACSWMVASSGAR